MIIHVVAMFSDLKEGINIHLQFGQPRMVSIVYQYNIIVQN